MDDFIKGSGNIWIIKVESFEEFSKEGTSQKYEKVNFSVIKNLRGETKIKKGYFTQQNHMCKHHVKINQKLVFFDAVNEKYTGGCDSSIRKMDFEAENIQELKEVARERNIYNAATTIRFMNKVCKSGKANCEKMITRMRARVCVFGDENPKECTEL